MWYTFAIWLAKIRIGRNLSFK